MTNCPVCQRETSPIKIGGQSYCNICGSKLKTSDRVPEPAVVAAPAAPGRRLSMDMAPRAAAATPPKTAAAPAPKPGTSAGALHGRVKPSQVLDLRHAEPKKVVHAAPAAPAHGIPAAPPNSTSHERHLAHLDMRLAQARQVERSAHIRKFSAGAPAAPVQMAPVAAPAAPEPRPIIPENRPVIIEPELPRHVITQHEAMTKLPHHPAAVAPAPKPVRARPKALLSGHRSRTFATVTAVALMGGYIWMSNYPKFALQNASNQAGLAASLPGYLPSSYSLKSTTTSPGLVTLNFSSPSAGDQLKIAQHRTTWDSSSLLDNFVAKTADDYSTVQSQGLTIYLFNNNQASWVNHGIWYSIEGASRLSREQILKIAYSL